MGSSLSRVKARSDKRIVQPADAIEDRAPLQGSPWSFVASSDSLPARSSSLSSLSSLKPHHSIGPGYDCSLEAWTGTDNEDPSTIRVNSVSEDTSEVERVHAAAKTVYTQEEISIHNRRVFEDLEARWREHRHVDAEIRGRLLDDVSKIERIYARTLVGQPRDAIKWRALLHSQWDLFTSLQFEHWREREHVLNGQIYRWIHENCVLLPEGFEAHRLEHAAWLWMEEFGPELWPTEMDQRGHIAPEWRDPGVGFVYLRDRVTSLKHRPMAWLFEHEHCMPWFTREPGLLNMHNRMFHKVVDYFYGVYEAFRGVNAIYDEPSAEQLIAQFLGKMPLVPHWQIRPRWYDSEHDDYNEAKARDADSLDGCECDVCTKFSRGELIDISPPAGGFALQLPSCVRLCEKDEDLGTPSESPESFLASLQGLDVW